MAIRLLVGTLLMLNVFVSPMAAQAPPPGTPDDNVIFMGTIKVKPGMEEDFRKALVDLAARTRREDTGIVRFEFYRAAPTRGTVDASAPQTWIEIEEWDTQAAAQAHQRWAGPVLQMTWRPLTESYEFVRLSPVNVR